MLPMGMIITALAMFLRLLSGLNEVVRVKYKAEPGTFETEASPFWGRVEPMGRRVQSMVSQGWRNWGHAGAIMETSGRRPSGSQCLSLRQPKSNQHPGPDVVHLLLWAESNDHGNAPITRSPGLSSPRVTQFTAHIRLFTETLSQNWSVFI